MSDHPGADYEALIDSASHYILSHAAAAGLEVEPPIWDLGRKALVTDTHTVQIKSGDSVLVLKVQHEWLRPESYSHGRFRTEVEAALAKLKSAVGSSNTPSR